MGKVLQDADTKNKYSHTLRKLIKAHKKLYEFLIWVSCRWYHVEHRVMWFLPMSACSSVKLTRHLKSIINNEKLHSKCANKVKEVFKFF